MFCEMARVTASTTVALVLAWLRGTRTEGFGDPSPTRTRTDDIF